MKILQVSNWYKPGWESGGVARYASNLAEQLVSDEHEVTVFTTDAYIDDPPERNPVSVDGVETYYFPNISNRITESTNLSLPVGVISTATKRVNEFDIVHIHEHRSPLAAITAYTAVKTGTPYFVQPHGSLPTSTGNTVFKKAWDGVIGNKLLDHADGYIALHEIEVSQFKAAGIDQQSISIVRNGFTLSSDIEPPDADEFEAEYGFDSTLPTFLYVGRISERKGVKMLVEALSTIKEIECIIIGPDSGNAERVKKAISNNQGKHIHYLGYVSEETKYAAYEYADAFVIPTRKGEGLPTTVLEALYFGNPIVATHAANVEFISEHQCGIISGNTVTGLRNTCLELLDCEMETMGEKGQKLVKEKFDWDSICENVQQIYSAKLNE